jgi:dienelactone hydrolase
MEFEKRIPIPGTDKNILGIFRDVPDAPIVVMVHCLTGNKNCVDQYVGARTFEQAGYASFRFDLYGWHDDQRDFLDCLLESHADDLDLVIATLRQEFPDRKIAVTGHSLGGPVILTSKNKDFDAVVLWDPTHTDCWETEMLEEEGYEWVPSLGVYRSRGGIEELISREYMESYRFLPSNKLISELHAPVKIIIAGGLPQRYIDGRMQFYEHANEPRDVTVIDGADHQFLNDGVMERLHDETIDWLDRTLG